MSIAAQIPLVPFSPSPAAEGSWPRPADPPGPPWLREGSEYRFFLGGVTRSILPLVERLQERGTLDEVHGVSLNPQAPSEARLRMLTPRDLALDGELELFGRLQEA
jgi:hypothetical protein